MSKKKRLGSEKRFADIGYGGFGYKNYKECSLAAAIEYGSIFLTLAGFAAVTLTVNKIGPCKGFGIMSVFVLFNFSLRFAAGKVNDSIVKRKISENTSYAKYFAAAYPEHEELCMSLNEEYAINPEAVPDEEFHSNRCKTEKSQIS